VTTTDTLDSFFFPHEGDAEVNHALVESYYWKDWAKAIRAYCQSPRDPYHSYWFLWHHPATQRFFRGVRLSAFSECLDIHYVKVDPNTHRIEDKKSRNTKTEVWLEWGPWIDKDDSTPNIPDDGMASHDYRCDVGARTFDKAIVKLAKKVWKNYRDGCAEAGGIGDRVE
jgi:hypothetical protein